LPDTELQSLRRACCCCHTTPIYVLDLHCDCEGVLHFYTEEPCWPQMAPLAHFLHSQTILLAKNSGNRPIDECLSSAWWQLADKVKAKGRAAPLPQGCCTTTIELRGELDVTHTLARQDAQAIVNWLQFMKVWASDCQPLVPCCRVRRNAPGGLGNPVCTQPRPRGVCRRARANGKKAAGDLIAEIINPIDGSTERVLAGVGGVQTPGRKHPQALRHQRGAQGRVPAAHAGDVISIIGSSGSGKSTFLRCINLLEKPQQGRIMCR
jgi:predicted deacylase